MKSPSKRLGNARRQYYILPGSTECSNTRFGSIVQDDAITFISLISCFWPFLGHYKCKMLIVTRSSVQHMISYTMN